MQREIPDAEISGGDGAVLWADRGEALRAQLDRLALLEEAVPMLSAGGYNGWFKVLYYQPDTHEKTIVNTEIPVNITVEP